MVFVEIGVNTMYLVEGMQVVLWRFTVLGIVWRLLGRKID